MSSFLKNFLIVTTIVTINNYIICMDNPLTLDLKKQKIYYQLPVIEKKLIVPDCLSNLSAKALIKYILDSEVILTDSLINIIPEEIAEIIKSNLISNYFEKLFKLKQTVNRQIRDITYSTVSNDKKYIVTIVGEDTIVLYEIDSGLVIQKKNFNNNSGITSIAISNDNSFIATASKDNKIKLWSLDGNELSCFSSDKRVKNLLISPDNNFIILITNTGHVIILDKKSNATIAELAPYDNAEEVEESDLPVPFFQTTFKDTIGICELSDNVLVISDKEGKIKLFDINKKEFLSEWEAHKKNISVISINQGFIFTGSYDFKVKMWDIETGELKGTFEHDNIITSISISRDGRYLLTGSYDNTARFWDLDTHECIYSFSHENYINMVQISPNKKLLVTCSDDGIKIWNSKTGQLFYSIEPHFFVPNTDLKEVRKRQVTNLYSNMLITSDNGMVIDITKDNFFEITHTPFAKTIDELLNYIRS